MKQSYLNKCIRNSVLCWLATVDAHGIPNVSPKEIFHLYSADTLIIANIASPKSLKNILTNSKVCVSMVDVFEQVGCKLVGQAMIITEKDNHFETYRTLLENQTGGKYPFQEVIAVNIESKAKIIAPSYVFYNEENVATKINRAMTQYGVQPK